MIKISQHGYVYQQTYSVSIPKEALTKCVIANEDLSKKDIRVCLLLLTKLGGYGIREGMSPADKRAKPDPLNYASIDINSIADTLNLKKKEVKNSINTLIDYGIIEEGSNDTVSKGYRFTF